MNSSKNKISADSIQRDIELIFDQNGIAISKGTFPVKNFVSTHNDAPFFVEDIIVVRIHKGNARIRINLNEYSITPKSLINLSPNYVIEMLDYCEDMEADILLFKYDLIANLPLAKNIGDYGKMFNQQPVLQLTDSDFNDLSDFYLLFKSHCHKKDEDYQREITKHIFFAACHQIIKLYSEKISSEINLPNRSGIIYREFITLLFLHYKSERDVQFYAEKLNITPKYFSRIVKKTSKRNASDLIDEMVINGIKATIKCTDQTILQISEEFNFPNPSYFGTYFKKRTGYTPHQYRSA